MEISTCWLFIVGKKSCETDFSAFSKKPRQGSSIKALAPIRRLLPPSQFKVRHFKLTAASCLFGLTVCVNNNYWMKQSLSVLTQATNEKCAALLQSPLCKNTGSGFPFQLHDTTCYSSASHCERVTFVTCCRADTAAPSSLYSQSPWAERRTRHSEFGLWWRCAVLQQSPICSCRQAVCALRGTVWNEWDVTSGLWNWQLWVSSVECHHQLELKHSYWFNSIELLKARILP